LQGISACLNLQFIYFQVFTSMNKQFFFCLLICLGLLQANRAKAQQYPITFVDLEVIDILMTVGLIDTSANAAIRTIFSGGQPYTATSASIPISQNALVTHGIHLITGTEPSIPSDTCWRISRLELRGKSIHIVSNVGINTDTAVSGNFGYILDSMRLDSLKHFDLSNNGLMGSFNGNFSPLGNPNTSPPLFTHTFNISDNWLYQTAVLNLLSLNIFPNLDTLLADNYTGIKKIPSASQRPDSMLLPANVLFGILSEYNTLSFLDVSNNYFVTQNILETVTTSLDTLVQNYKNILDFEALSNIVYNGASSNNPNIKYFKCTNCNAEGFTSLNGLPNLETLILDSNFISTDSIRLPLMSAANTYPSYDLGNLKVLSLAHNKLNGNFPLHWFFGTTTGSISRPVQKIYLQHNQLTGIDQTLLEQRLGNTPFLVPSRYLVSASTTPVLSSATAGVATISTNALTTVRLDHNNFDFADLYAFNVSMGLGISPAGTPTPLINMPVDTVRGNNYQNIQNTHTSAVYYSPQDSIGMGGVRRRAAGERTRFELASTDPLLDFSLRARQQLLSQAPYAASIQRNGYTWYNTDTSNSNRQNLVVFTPNTTGTGSARVTGTIATPNNTAATLGIIPVEPGYARPPGLNDDRFAGAYLERLNPALERSKLGISTTNANFPALQLNARMKTIMTGGCMDSLGRAVRCQEISVQYDTNYINLNRGTRSVEEYKKALRDTAGAYVLETCVCGNAELWALYDTTQMGLHLLANQANYGSQTATTASMTRRPGLKSADMNYVIVPNMNENPNTPDDSVAYANASVQKRRTLIAHLDSGVDYDLPALMPYLRRNNSDLKNDTLDNDANGVVNDFIGYNFFDRNSQPADDLGHGTQIAGILAGLSTPSVHAMGANQAHDTVDILPVRFTNFRNEGTSYNAACGIYYAAEYHRIHDLQTNLRTGIDTTKSPVRVINASWGYQGESCKLLYDAIKYAGDECNILFVTAAGNDNRINIDQTPFYPANYKLKNILTVTSADPTLFGISNYANVGASNVDIAAVGTITQTTNINGQITAPVEGTSFSTPMVARAAGILFNKYPNASAYAVKTAILKSAVKFIGRDTNLVRSKGVLDMNAAIFYMDSMMTANERIACDTVFTDSSLVIVDNGIDPSPVVAPEEPSDSTSISPNPIVSITEPIQSQHFSVYPNPAHQSLHIIFNQPTLEPLQLRLLNINGQIILEKQLPNPSNNRVNLDIHTLDSGFYMLYIQQGAQIWATKVLKL
jgi:Subtilase family/Secretion system C-terminal sorting domain